MEADEEREHLRWLVQGQSRALLKILDMKDLQHAREVAGKALQRFPEFPPEKEKRHG